MCIFIDQLIKWSLVTTFGIMVGLGWVGGVEWLQRVNGVGNVKGKEVHSQDRNGSLLGCFA